MAADFGSLKKRSDRKQSNDDSSASLANLKPEHFPYYQKLLQDGFRHNQALQMALQRARDQKETELQKQTTSAPAQESSQESDEVEETQDKQTTLQRAVKKCADNMVAYLSERIFPQWLESSDERIPIDQAGDDDALLWPTGQPFPTFTFPIQGKLWTTKDIIIGYPGVKCPKLFVGIHYARNMFDKTDWKQSAVRGYATREVGHAVELWISVKGIAGNTFEHNKQFRCRIDTTRLVTFYNFRGWLTEKFLIWAGSALASPHLTMQDTMEWADRLTMIHGTTKVRVSHHWQAFVDERRLFANPKRWTPATRMLKGNLLTETGIVVPEYQGDPQLEEGLVDNEAMLQFYGQMSDGEEDTFVKNGVENIKDLHQKPTVAFPPAPSRHLFHRPLDHLHPRSKSANQ